METLSRNATTTTLRSLRGARGFTLLEMIIVSLVLIALTATVLQAQRTTTQAQVQQQLSLQAQQAARLAINAIADEVRMADPICLNPTGLGAGNVGDIDQALLQFWTVTWDAGVVPQQRDPGNWLQYQLDVTGTMVERVQFVEEGVNGTGIPPALLNEMQRTAVARNIYQEVDLNGNGILDPAEDLNGDNVWQRGLWFQVRQEDVNDDDTMGLTEDAPPNGNGNGKFDAQVIITVDTRIVGAGPLGGVGYATVSTAVEPRNGEMPGA